MQSEDSSFSSKLSEKMPLHPRLTKSGRNKKNRHRLRLCHTCCILWSLPDGTIRYSLFMKSKSIVRALSHKNRQLSRKFGLEIDNELLRNYTDPNIGSQDVKEVKSNEEASQVTPEVKIEPQQELKLNQN